MSLATNSGSCPFRLLDTREKTSPDPSFEVPADANDWCISGSHPFWPGTTGWNADYRESSYPQSLGE